MAFALDHVALHVIDVEGCVAFYRDTLGLPEIPARVARQGVRWFQLAGGATLHLIPGAPDKIALSPSNHFALATADFDAVISTLQQNGVAFGGGTATPTDGKVTTRPDNVRQVYLMDPDNNLVEINDQP